MITVQEVVDRTGANLNTIYRWIDRGFLEGVKVNSKGSHGTHWEFDETEFERFLRSDDYIGNPEKLKGCASVFQRVPVLEDCYPYNLLKSILVWNEEDEEPPTNDIFSIDMRKFKTFIIQLTDREQRVLELRYQFGLTLEEVAVMMGLTRERIRQLQVKAERKLKHRICAYGCSVVPKSDYLDICKKYDLLTKENEAIWRELAELKGERKSITKEDNANEIDYETVIIEDLDLSVRSYNCLKRAGISTLADIFSIDQSQTPDDDHKWLKIRNLGRKSLVEIAGKIYNHCGYRIRDYDGTNHTWTMFPIPEDDEEEK